MSDTSNEQQLTAKDVLAPLQRVCVRGNGSCWVYVLLACLWILEHAKITSEEEASSEPKRKKRKGRKKAKKKKSPADDVGPPSDRDHNFDNAIRKYLFDNHSGLLGEYAATVLIGPDDDSFGDYGGQEHFAALAAAFKVDIVLYDDAKELQTLSRMWSLFSAGSGDEEILTANEIQERMNDQASQRAPVLHVAVSRDYEGHFEAYRCKKGLDDTSYEFPSWFLKIKETWANIIDSAEQ